jgi:hypothetical protein
MYGMYAHQVLQRHLSEEALAEAQERLQTTRTQCVPVQGPTAKGGLSHLLLTHASMFLASTCDLYLPY